MSQIEIIDDYLPEDIFNEMQDLMLSAGIPWFFNDYIVTESPDLFQLVHTFTPDKPYVQLLNPLLKKLNPREVLRCKANLRPQTSQNIQSPYHLDQTNVHGTYKSYKVAIYYINTNNGYTIFEHNKQKVQSIANRILLFDGTLKHAGCSCTDAKRRVVLNINYMEK